MSVFNYTYARIHMYTHMDARMHTRIQQGRSPTEPEPRSCRTSNKESSRPGCVHPAAPGTRGQGTRDAGAGSILSVPQTAMQRDQKRCWDPAGVVVSGDPERCWVQHHCHKEPIALSPSRCIPVFPWSLRCAEWSQMQILGRDFPFKQGCFCGA